MKLKMYLALLAMGMLSLQSCNDDDDDLPNSKVPEAVRNAFDSSFSNTANLSWETKTVSQGQYYKAEFNNKSDNGYKTEAWYTADGSWYMTETEMPYSDIPQAIKTSFESSEYASWKRDNEVERIERAGTEKEIIYIIEVQYFIEIFSIKLQTLIIEIQKKYLFLPDAFLRNQLIDYQ